MAFLRILLSACWWMAASAAASELATPAGIKVGEGRLHPYFDLEGRYDSAAGYFGANQLGGELVARFRPGLRFVWEGNNHLFHFDGSGDYVWYTGALNPGSSRASRLQAEISADAVVNKNGVVSVELGDQLTRSDRLGTPVFGLGVLSVINSFRIGVPIRPGGGALEIKPNATWAIEFFEPLVQGSLLGCAPNDPLCASNQLSQLNYSNANVGVSAKWKFLPKTALIADTNADFRTYWLNQPLGIPATVYRIQAGLAGMITPKISATLLAGYVRDFLTSQASTVMGTAEIGYGPVETVRFRLGYNRGVTPQPTFGTMVDDRGYLEANVQFLARLNLRLMTGVDYLSFFSTTPRNDLVVSADFSPSFRVNSWFQVATGYIFTFRTSTASTPGLQFQRHEVWLKFSFSY